MIFAKMTSTDIITANASKVGTIVVCVCMVLHPAIQAFTTVPFALVVALMVPGHVKFPTTVGKTLNRAIMTSIVTTIPIATCTNCIISTNYVRLGNWVFILDGLFLSQTASF